MVVDAFLRWARGAKSKDRARAANALGRAYLFSPMSVEERHAAEMAMVYLLDDPAPAVRAALSEALAWSKDAPRAVVLSLAGDKPEVAAHVLICSPLLSDHDLVEIAVRGSSATRMMIAARAQLSPAVCAAIGEIGDKDELLCLLENEGASLPSFSLNRIAERFGHNNEIRDVLLSRPDLSLQARQLLAMRLSAAFADMPLVQALLPQDHLAEMAREALETTACAIAEEALPEQLPELVGFLQQTEQLTTSLMMRALCTGRTEFFAAAIVALTRCDERRVRSVIANGRSHAVSALYELAGIPADMTVVFVEATILWRNAAASRRETIMAGVTRKLVSRFSKAGGQLSARQELIEFVQRLQIDEQRASARHYASSRLLTAA